MSCGCGCGGEVVAYEDWEETDVIAAEYQGRSVTLNKPFRTKGESKKFGVYTKNEKGNVVLVRFGDPNLSIKRDQKKNRESFMARMRPTLAKVKGQKNLSPVYWAIRSWQLGTKI